VLTAPPPVEGRPWIRRFRHRKVIMSHCGTLDELLLEDTLFMDQLVALSFFSVFFFC
jgi:hypothetical protein